MTLVTLLSGYLMLRIFLDWYTDRLTLVANRFCWNQWKIIFSVFSTIRFAYGSYSRLFPWTHISSNSESFPISSDKTSVLFFLTSKNQSIFILTHILEISAGFRWFPPMISSEIPRSRFLRLGKFSSIYLHHHHVCSFLLSYSTGTQLKGSLPFMLRVFSLPFIF